MMSRVGPVVLAISILFPGCGGPKPASADARFREASLQLRLGNLEQAFALADREYRRWQALSDAIPHWQFRNLKAEILMAQGRTKEALTLVETSPPPGAAFREQASRRLMNLGRARYLLAEYPESERLLNEAFQVASEGGPAGLLAEIELRRGSTLARLRRFTQADRSYRNALELATRQDDLYLQAAALGNLGFLHLNAARYDEALPFFEQALPLSERAGARKFVATTLGNLGRCYQGLGDFDKAIALLSKAASLAGQVGDLHGRQVWLGDLGEVYHHRSEFPAAVSHYRQALEVSRRLDIHYSTLQWLNSLTLTLIRSGDLAAADKYNREALALSPRVQMREEHLRARLGSALILAGNKQPAAAEKTYREVIAGASPFDEYEPLWEAQGGLGALLAENSRWAEADQEFRRALATIEETRSRLARDEWKLSFHSSSMRFYHDYVDFLMSRGRGEQALEVAESCRARVLAQKLGLARIRSPLATAAAFRRSARDLRAVLMSFWLAPRRSFLWVVRPEGVESFVLPPAAEVDSLAQAYKDAIHGLRDPLETRYEPPRRLYETLIGPVARTIPRGARIVVVPDGPLHEVNLESLVTGSEPPRYWIEDVCLAVAPSLGLLSILPSAGRPGPDSLLLIGNPAPPSGEFPPLPDVEREIGGVRRAFPGAGNAVFVGAAAHPGVYREAGPERFSVIHFAAHATASRENPLDSAVILSRRGDGYKLYARDLIGLPLKARLVTISACRGAGARFYSGEGLVGFAWAFLQAGAGSVLAGLWDVNDKSTAALMERLYAAMGSSQGPAAALRAAKLALIQAGGAWRKPYYWAPFQLYTRSQPF